MQDNFLKFLVGFNLFILSVLVLAATTPSELDLSGEYNSETKVASFHGSQIGVPGPYASGSRIAYDSQSQVLGKSTC